MNRGIAREHYIKFQLASSLYVVVTLTLIRIPKFSPSLNVLKFSDFEPRISIKLVPTTTGVTSSGHQRNIFKSLLMSYFIIKQNVSEREP